MAQTRPELPVRWADRQPALGAAAGTSSFDRHYVYHVAWAARVLAELRPERHVDISSLLFFNAVASAFVPIDFYEYRPAEIELDRLTSRHADLTALPFDDASIPSLSCMHVVEHIGLGRYGDPLDPRGDLVAMLQLQRVLARGGTLLFVVPVGRPRVQFNAHRIYGYEQVLEGFRGLRLVEFALIPDSAETGNLMRHADPSLVSEQRYACGCFRFERGD
jgi:SAM-dependent methyltransferase